MAWTSTLAEVDRLSADYTLSPEVRENSQLLILFSRQHYPRPDSVSVNNYQATLSFHWTSVLRPLEIEVHDSHFELYLFALGKTEIQHFPTVPDGSFPFTLAKIMNKALAVNPSA